MDPAAAVEVCLQQDHNWSQARLLDVDISRCKARVLLEFAAGEFPGRSQELELDGAQVRPSPPLRLWPRAEDLEPKIDDIIEVLQPSCSSRPACWSCSVVRKIKGSFLFVSPLGSGREEDLLVKAAAVRRVSKERSLREMDLVEEVLTLPETLVDWLWSEEGLNVLIEVRTKARLLSASRKASSLPRCAEVQLVGEASELVLGSKLLMQVHLPHWAELLQRRRVLQRLNVRLQRVLAFPRRASPGKSSEPAKGRGKSGEELERLEFEVEEDIVAHIVGKQGNRLSKIQEKFGVKVKVLKQAAPDKEDSDNRAKYLVQVSGPSSKALESARRQLDLVKVKLPMPKEVLEQIFGEAGLSVRGIAQKVRLVFASYDEVTMALTLCGSKAAVESARSLLRSPAGCRPAQKDLSSQLDALQGRFEALGKSPARQLQQLQSLGRAFSASRNSGDESGDSGRMMGEATSREADAGARSEQAGADDSDSKSSDKYTENRESRTYAVRAKRLR